MNKIEIENFKKKILPLYESLREDGKKCKKDETYGPFIMQWGEEFPVAKNNGMIFYGRATNGWSGSWDYDIFFSDDNEKRGWNRDNQMKWVQTDWRNSEGKYDPAKSQFWKVVRRVAEEYYKEGWYKHVAWSNICKVAPCSERNPTERVFYATLENNKKVFRAEIDFWSPKYVVLLTDGMHKDGSIIDWTSEFVRSLNHDNLPPLFHETKWGKDERFAIQAYKSGERYIILSLHPQGRKIDLHVKAIIETIEYIEKNS